MSTRLFALVAFILVVLISIPLVSLLLKGKPEPAQPLVTLQVSEGREIHISSRLVVGGAISLYYEPVTTDQPARPKAAPDPDAPEFPAFFGTLPVDAPRVRFVTYTADEGSLVGVAQAERPHHLIILHDFASGASWPAYPRWADMDYLEAQAQVLFPRLKAAHPDEPLELLEAENMFRPLTLPEAEPAPDAEL